MLELLNFRVLPGILWVEAQAAAIEVDGGFEILDIPEIFRSSLDGHDLAVQALGHPVGDRVLAVCQNIFELLMDHGADPLDWFQLAPVHPLLQ